MARVSLLRRRRSHEQRAYIACTQPDQHLLHVRFWLGTHVSDDTAHPRPASRRPGLYGVGLWPIFFTYDSIFSIQFRLLLLQLKDTP